MQRKLSELVVRNLKPGEMVWDTLLPGFGVRVGARTRTWIVAIRRPGAKHPVRLKIGTYPDLLLGEARAALARSWPRGRRSSPSACAA